MTARRFLAELFSNKNQGDKSVEQDGGRRRLSVSHSGKFRQKNLRRKEIQKDTFVPVPQDNKSKSSLQDTSNKKDEYIEEQGDRNDKL